MLHCNMTLAWPALADHAHLVAALLPYALLPPGMPVCGAPA